MSSTNRLNASKRHVADYYVTPQEEIRVFLRHFKDDEGLDLSSLFFRDPCAGGDEKNGMSYPEVLSRDYYAKRIETMDIREDSRAEKKEDFLLSSPELADVTITNPPFNLAMPIIEKAIRTTKWGGYVVMLLRLNFLGSQSRKAFWDENPAHKIYVHHKRMSFTEDGATDSIEYAHFVWKIGSVQETTLRVI